MCFIEYLGYTCGHTSLSVLRTCPQTTGIPTNPVCNKPAERPQLMSSFCVPCAHIQHKRWSDIAEQEHRWMHERGVCGCPVQFPDLMQPRMVVGGGRRGNYGVMDSDGTTCTIVGGGDFMRPSDNHNHHYHHGSGNAYGKKNKRGGKNWRRGGGGGGGHHHHHSHNQQASRTQQQKDEYPALQEIREGDDVRYAVRLPSTYGVEWAWDHEKVHREGKCSCDVRFDKYVPQYNLPNTQYSLVQGSPEPAATASGNQTYNAATSNNGFLVTRPFEQSPAQPSTQSSFTTQSSTAQSSEAQSSMQSWVQPFMQSSEQQQQQQQQHRYGQTSATQAFGIQQGYPQYFTQNVAPPQSSSEQHSGSTGSGGLQNYAQDHHHHHNNNNNNNNTQPATFGQPFTPGISQTMMTTGADAFSQTMPDSITDLFAQQPDNSNAAPSVTSSSYAIPRVPIDSDSMAAAWNLSQPQRWTCNPPAGFYNDQQVYLPPPLPTTTTTNTNKINTTGLPIAHGTNTAAAAAASNNKNNNNNNDKGKAKVNAAANDNNMTIRGGSFGFSSNANANADADADAGNGSGGGPGGYGGFGCPARPVDMQTMWFSPSQEHDAQAPLVGCPIGMGPEGPDGSLQVPGQIYQHAKTEDAIPLNGFPIGAGPEGDAHAGSFEECELYYHRGSGSGSVGREGRDGHALRRTGSSSF